MNKPPITGVIITKNEVAQIGKTLEALLPCCSEVLVFDSGSTDGTIEICKNLGATVVQTQWLGYGQTKNLGHKMAKNDWILSIDADEVINEELAKNIQAIHLNNSKIIYQLKRYEILNNYEIRFTIFKPSFKPRLFHKNEAKWDNKKVHETLTFNTNHRLMPIAGKLLHYSNDSFESFQKQTKKYAFLAADDLFKKGKTISFVKKYFGPTFTFFKSFIILGGIFDGKIGYTVSKMAANSIKWRHQYYNEMDK